MQMHRQGDILFIRREKTPRGGNLGHLNIAVGSATGHSHRVRANDPATLREVGGVRFVVAKGETHIDHDEHGTLVLAKGAWEIRRQREATPEGFRQVED